MSNNNQTPNWDNNPPGSDGQWPGQPNPGNGQGPIGAPAPHPGVPQPGTVPQGYPLQGDGQRPQQVWGPQAGSQQAPPAKKKSRTPVIIAVAVSLVLLVGGVVFAMNFMRGATPAAAEGIPADALAVVEVNLNPAVTDKLAVKGFVEKFPALAEDVADIDGDYKKALYLTLTDDTDDAPDYSTVEPWLGDSMALALLPSPEGTNDVFGLDPNILLAVQVTDRDKAEAFMAEHGEGAQVAFMDDLMLVTDEGAPTPDVDGISNAPLADGEDYAADMAKLGGSWLATAWMSSDLVEESLTAGSETTGIIPPLLYARVAMGMKIEDGSAVMRAVSWSDQDLADGPATSFLGSLPATSVGAMSFSLSDSVHEVLWEQVDPLLAESPEMGDALGIQSQDDLRAILGSELAVALEVGQDGMPAVGVKVRTDDPVKHESFLETLGTDLGMAGIEHVTDGDVVTTTFGQSPADFSNPADTLGDNETVTELTRGSGDPQSVMWVDVPAVLAMPELGLDESDEMMQNLEPLSGVGVSSSFLGDGYAESFVRVGTK